MNRFIIFFCIGAVLSAVTEGSPRDVEFDFLETLMSDGHYPEHFFTEEAQVMPMQEHADKKSMLLQKRDELKDDCDDAICETEGRAKRNILMNGKAIATKEKAFSKVLKFAKAAVAKALKATQALVLTEKLKVKITPKMMVRNAVYLKAFAVLNADKLDYSSKRLGILGTLLTLLMVKSKKSPVAQYADSIKMLAETNKKGLPRYMLRAIATSMMGDGVVSMGPIPHKVGQYVKKRGVRLTMLLGYSPAASTRFRNMGRCRGDKRPHKKIAQNRLQAQDFGTWAAAMPKTEDAVGTNDPTRKSLKIVAGAKKSLAPGRLSAAGARGTHRRARATSPG